MPKPTWTHPKIGRFAPDDDTNPFYWTADLAFPQMDVFVGNRSLGLGRTCRRRPYTLALSTFDSEHTIQQLADYAVRVLAHARTLPALTAQAFWNDFTGRGPDSGQFWHNESIDYLFENCPLDNLTPPTGPRDLARFLRFNSLTVLPDTLHRQRLHAVLSFDAYWDTEHGASIITDGRRVFGIGQGCADEADTFEQVAQWR